LLAGIAYGAFWQSRYEKKELSLKPMKLKEKAERDERIAHEKKLAAESKYMIVLGPINIFSVIL
jgi:hypothetical protein